MKEKTFGLRGWIALIMGGVAVVCAGLIVLDSQTTLVSRAYLDGLLGNRDHALPCEQLPTFEEAERIIATHRAEIERIEQVNPGQVFVHIGEPCTGQADLVVNYASRQDREEIEALIDGDTFYGVPYRMRNR